MNVQIALYYLEAWLRGVGCVPLNDLMEDAATAEISRAQIWQWIRHKKVEFEEVKQIFLQEMKKETGNFDLAGQILLEVTGKNDFEEFLTLIAYGYLE